jgi:hypothetical protein
VYLPDNPFPFREPKRIRIRVSIQPEDKHLDGLSVEDAVTVRTSQPGLGEQRTLPSSFVSPRPDFLHSQLADHSDYSTLMPTLVTVRAGPSNGAVTTAWISLPSLTSTKAKFTNPPVLVTI